MKGEERRKEILKLLRSSDEPIAAHTLASQFHVSRQAVVQDIALLRANGENIYSTNRGYCLRTDAKVRRVFKVSHTDEETEEELTMIIDLGGTVEDVFVYHRTYGLIRGPLNLHSRRDIAHYLEQVRTGKSSYLKNVTSNFHYHTVSAASEEILDDIQDALQKRGFLAKLQDYEPVDFWTEKETQKQDS